jgi:hypothetical protein
MNFKMTGKDFEVFSKFIEKKAKGSELTFRSDNNEKLEVRLTLADGTDCTIIFVKDGFAKITRARNLSEEL